MIGLDHFVPYTYSLCLLFEILKIYFFIIMLNVLKKLFEIYRKLSVV